MDSFASFFGLKKSHSTSTSSSHHQQQQQQERKQVVVVSYADRYYDIPFGNHLNQATVGELKDRCKQATGVTLATMKLKVSGAFIKDDTATLQSSGIHSGCVVLMYGDRVNTQQVKQTASGNPEEVGFMSRISKVMDKIDGCKDQIEDFDIRVVSIIENPQGERKETEDLGIYLSELLMQALITLDGVDCPSQFETARANRRKGVKICQELMDRVDQTRATLKKVQG